MDHVFSIVEYTKSFSKKLSKYLAHLVKLVNISASKAEAFNKLIGSNPIVSIVCTLFVSILVSVLRFGILRCIQLCFRTTSFSCVTPTSVSKVYAARLGQGNPA